MNKAAPVVIVVIALLIGYVAAGPFIVLHQIRNGFDQDDAEKLNDNIDFPVLRQNLKDQINAAVLQQSLASDSALGAAFGALATGIMGELLDAYVTPSGLIALTESKSSQALVSGAGGDGFFGQADKDLSDKTKEYAASITSLFSNNEDEAVYIYDSLDKFSLWYRKGNDNEIRFVISRDGLKWKLSNVILPISNVLSDSLSAEGAQKKKKLPQKSVERQSEIPRIRSNNEASQKAGIATPNLAMDAEDARRKAEIAERQAAEARKPATEARRAEDARKAEEASRQAAVTRERNTREQSGVDKYVEIIKQKVERNWIKPVQWQGKRCRVRVNLMPGGAVMQVRIVASSGDPMFDSSVEAAVQKASPLPVPSASDPLFDHFRELEIVYDPKG